MRNTKSTKLDQMNNRDQSKVEERIDPSDINELGTWLVERNQNILNMLDEYDQRKEKRTSTKR